MIALYLAAVVAANLSAAIWGPSVTVLNAFLFIGFDLTARDRLHERWNGNPYRMGALIVAGSAISWVINQNAGRIGLASAVAFGAAGVVDWAVYQALKQRHRLVRMNGSNVPSALVDSLVFPTLAFGSFLPLVVLGQWAAKVFGGAVWSWIIHRNTLPNVAARQ